MGFRRKTPTQEPNSGSRKFGCRPREGTDAIYALSRFELATPKIAPRAVMVEKYLRLEAFCRVVPTARTFDLAARSEVVGLYITACASGAAERGMNGIPAQSASRRSQRNAMSRLGAVCGN
jgi:hypothetical protein